ncbi:MLO-like protein 12 [Platanthera zijinensis]|uniref:MLO-like protein 12 n=1 Tax=Platanthera zijinensis TaxID=2320716 RepID=A0AAP0BZB3_9ASPA
MGSTMRETIFTDRVVAGLKNWRSTAKKSLFSKESGDGSNSPATPSVSHLPLLGSPKSGQSSTWTHHHPPLPLSIMPSPTDAASSSSSTPAPASTSSKVGRGGLSSSRTSSAAARFEFPTRRRELEEIQKVTEEMMGASRSCGGGFEGGGEMSFRMWWHQEMTSPIGGRRSSKTAAFCGVDEENN